ncbi:hypothetical protein [Bradyrhizobium sp. AZCC 2262]|uniref:hypothetical protein n=1 Tax=Bradyrhizobium sp. AZCC 2262 TaxID=3117022 RepID=UPI002FEEF9EE
MHEAYQLRIIGFGKAEHVRNRSHRVRHRNIGRKIADAGAVGDGVHRDLRPVTQPFFQGQERSRGERSLEDGAIPSMVRVIHFGQATHDLWLAADLSQGEVHGFAGQIGSWFRPELLAAEFDGQNVGMSRQRPKRFDPANVHPVHRR